jgi:urease accessory protein
LLAAPGLVLAHPGHGPDGFASGVLHPISGLDHLLAMLAVGMWASQVKGKALVAMPLAFVCAMLLGGILKAIGVTLPLVEAGIATSVLVLGLFVAFVRALPLAMSAGLIAVLALFHGYAHFAEMPVGSSPFAYAAGFAIASAALHALGAAASVTASPRAVPNFARLCGCVIAAAGVVLVALAI